MTPSPAAGPPVERRTLTLHGHEVSYRMGGEGEALLLVHGLAGSATTWKDVAPLLARDRTVIAPDLLGHGESAKPVGDYSLGNLASGLRDMLAVLDVERATVVGHSLGGGVAMQLSYQYPELVERLVLVCSGGLGREVSFFLRAAALPGAELVMPVLFPSFVADWGNGVSRWVADRGWSAPKVAELWRGYSSLASTDHRKAFVRTVRSVIDPGGQTVSALDRLYLAEKLPTLIVWGEDDPIIPVDHARAAHDALPGSRLEILEGCGHFPHVEAPQRFVTILDDFLATTEPAHVRAEDFSHLLQGDPPSV